MIFILGIHTPKYKKKNTFEIRKGSVIFHLINAVKATILKIVIFLFIRKFTDVQL
jgi:hypothetical protein